MSKYYHAIGLMSGTSLDGIDVALITTDGENMVQRGPARTYAYAQARQQRLHEALVLAKDITDPGMLPPELSTIAQELTEWHVEAVQNFLQHVHKTPQDIDYIGFHGQTVLHRPDLRFTLQLGDGDKLARKTGIATVYDLRAADVAAGGQGAPLVPVYHRALATAMAEQPVVLLNIGGVANVTWIGRNGDMLAFDSGPGNALLNDWVMKHSGQPYDVDGQMAARGTLNQAIVAEALAHPFFHAPPPKSLDRNSFRHLKLAGLSPEDGAATLLAITVASIARSLQWMPEKPARMIVCGGGRKNKTMMAALTAELGPIVSTAEDYQFDGDAMEAEAWAYLAVRSVKKLPITFPGTTRAPHPLTGGRLALP